MNKLYILLFISSAATTNTIFCMEDAESKEKGILATLRGIVRRGSFSKKKEEPVFTRTRSNSSSGYSLPMWRSKTTTILLRDAKLQSFTAEERIKHTTKLKEYLLMGNVIQARSQEEWTEEDSARLAQLGKLAASQEVSSNTASLVQSVDQSPTQSDVFDRPEILTWHENAMDLTDVYLKRKYTDVAHNKKTADCIIEGIAISKTVSNGQEDIQRIVKMLCEYYLKQTEFLKDEEIQKKRTAISVLTTSTKKKS